MAKHWYELYVHHTPGGEQMMVENEMPPHDSIMDGHLVALIEPDQVAMAAPNPVMAGAGSSAAVVVTTAPPQPYQPAPTLAPLGITIPYAAVGHYNFLHHPHHPHHVGYGGPIHPLHQPPPAVQMYQFQYPPPPQPQPPQVGY